jgi:hypothetical protein
VRLSITILLLLFAVTIKANKATHPFNGDVFNTGMASQKPGIHYNASDLTRESIDGSEIKKDIPSAHAYILHSIYQVSFAAKEHCHFPGTLFSALAQVSRPVLACYLFYSCSNV